MPLRLMAVLAHPDDESLGVGGTLAKCAAEGVETFVVTATLGERGRYHGHAPGDPLHPGEAALRGIRETELRAAVKVLGVRELFLLGYQDQAVDRADPREAITRIVMSRRARAASPAASTSTAKQARLGSLRNPSTISQATARRRSGQFSWLL